MSWSFSISPPGQQSFITLLSKMDSLYFASNAPNVRSVLTHLTYLHTNEAFVCSLHSLFSYLSLVLLAAIPLILSSKLRKLEAVAPRHYSLHLEKYTFLLLFVYCSQPIIIACYTRMLADAIMLFSNDLHRKSCGNLSIICPIFSLHP